MSQIFDRKLLKQNQARAAAQFSQHSFLYHEIANRIFENLQSFSRNFENCLEIGPRDGYLSSLMAGDKNFINVQNAEDEEIINFVTQFSNDNSAFAPEVIKQENFDLIVSNLNLHHINLIPQFLLQVKSLLKPRGMFIATFFGEENLPELHETVFTTENQLYSGVSPRMIPTIDVKTAAHLLQKAGFDSPLSNLEQVSFSYCAPLKLLKDLKNMGQGNIMTKRSRRFFTKKFLTKVCENYAQNYSLDDGAVKATFEIITVVGFK